MVGADSRLVHISSRKPPEEGHLLRYQPESPSAGIAHRSSLTLWAPGGQARSGSVSTALGALNQPRKKTTVVTSEAKRSNNKGAKRTPRSLH